MKPMKYSMSVVAAVVAVVAGHASARAQSSTAQAEALFRQGKDLIARGKFAEACAAFDASQKLDPTLATLLNQASCREKNGQLATAWGLFLEAERQSRTATTANGRQLHRVAVDHAAKLEPRLSTLTVTVPGDSRVAGLEILRNNEPIDHGAWNQALPVDGGTYTVTARAPGNTDWSTTVTVNIERDAKAVEIPKLKAAALKPAEPTPPTTADSAPAPVPGLAPASTTTQPRSKLLPIVLGGTAVGLLGGGVVFELSARSTYDDAKAEQDNARQTSLWHSANTKRHVAQGFAAAGIACAGVAIWLYLRGDSAESPASPSTTATSGAATSAQARRSPASRSPAGSQRYLFLQPVLTGEQAGLLLQGSY